VFNITLLLLLAYHYITLNYEFVCVCVCVCVCVSYDPLEWNRIVNVYVCLLLTYLLNTYFLSYLLTPWNRVLLEKLTGSQLVKKFLAFYGTRKFITAFTSARHLSLS